MKIYLASPIFKKEELERIKETVALLREKGHTVFSPSENDYSAYERGSAEWSRVIFEADRDHVAWADAVVCLYYGAFSDSGTAWECGYAYGLGKKVIVVHVGEDSNLMVHEGCHTNIRYDELKDYDFDALPQFGYRGEMY